MISGIALTAHTQRGRSFSWVCVTWTPTLPHPVLHIPLIWYVGQALHLGSTGDDGSSTPADLDFRVIRLIAPACRKRAHLSSTYALLYPIALGLSSHPVLPPLDPPPSAAWVSADSSPFPTTRWLILCRCCQCGDCPLGGS